MKVLTEKSNEFKKIRDKIPDGKLLLAFSGGSDSLFLMYILSQYAKERTTALYVNHNIREEEELKSEIELNKKNAERFGINLVIKEISKGDIERYSKENKCGLEAACRVFRYKVLREYKEENDFDYILTAHQEEDQIESVLIRIRDTSPPWSLGGIKENDGDLVRPILSVKKDFILTTLSSLGLKYSEDSTNLDTKYKRNNIRHHISGYLSKSERDGILKLSSSSRELSQNIKDIFFDNKGLYVTFSKREFLLSSLAERERLIYRIFNALGKNERVKRSFIKEIGEEIEKGYGSGMWSGLLFYFGEEVKVFKTLNEFYIPITVFNSYSKDLYIEMGVGDEKTLKIPNEALSTSVLRTSLEGDRINLCSGWRKVSDFKKEYRIPEVVLLEKDGEILALFSSFLGGRDRISSSLLGKDGIFFTLKTKKV